MTLHGQPPERAFVLSLTRLPVRRAREVRLLASPTYPLGAKASTQRGLTSKRRRRPKGNLEELLKNGLFRLQSGDMLAVRNTRGNHGPVLLTRPAVVVSMDDPSSSDSESAFEDDVPIKPEPMDGILLPTANSGAAFRPKRIVLRDDYSSSSSSLSSNSDANENVGPRPRKGGSRNPFGPILSTHIQTLLASANQVFVDSDLANATELILECYDEQKELAKGLQLRIMGAHLRQDSEERDRLARQSKTMGYAQQARQKGFYCEGVKSKEYVAVLWDCVMLAREVDDPRHLP
ncbi:TPR-like protein [Mycena chlorophos]|uniref:TPR-like protein n=1 Tax=Mycena chlorophos TaxID=658473 RepID=A0A8H6VS74_MYCCL|nr:TPR-like protein [Mycena chlorophos]